jgi:transposase-like protein
MSIQFACNAQETVKVAVQETVKLAVMRDFGRPKCPRCGSMMMIAEESEFNVRGCIRHAWACDDCAHEFTTSIALRPR